MIFILFRHEHKPISFEQHEQHAGETPDARVIGRHPTRSGGAVPVHQQLHAQEQTSAQHTVRPARAHEQQTTVLVQLPHFHGHRRLAAKSVARQGDLRVDPGTLSVFQKRTYRLEEQRAPQPVPEQVLPEGRKGPGTD